MRRGWDAQHGGLVYGFAPDGTVCDADKYFWVQAEPGRGRAAGDPHRRRRRMVGLRPAVGLHWTHLVDHRHGAWLRILTPDNRACSDEKSPAGKTDYHTMGACWDVLRAMGRCRQRRDASGLQSRSGLTRDCSQVRIIRTPQPTASARRSQGVPHELALHDHAVLQPRRPHRRRGPVRHQRPRPELMTAATLTGNTVVNTADGRWARSRRSCSTCRADASPMP